MLGAARLLQSAGKRGGEGLITIDPEPLRSGIDCNGRQKLKGQRANPTAL